MKCVNLLHVGGLLCTGVVLVMEVLCVVACDILFESIAAPPWMNAM